MKEILAKKIKFEDCDTIVLTKGSNSIIDRKLPLKLKDPSTFHIQCINEDHQSYAFENF